MRLAALTIAVFALATAARATPLGDADKGDIDIVILADMDDATYDAQFACPETLPTADDREEEFERYTTWAHLRHPDWNFQRRLEARTGLLRRHNCTATLAKVTSSGEPAFPGWAYPPRK
jgi:hypothetical protein